MVKTSVCLSGGLAFFALVLGSLILLPGLPISVGMPSAVILAIALCFAGISFFDRPREFAFAGGVAGCFLTLLYFLGDPPLRAHAFFQSPFPVLTWLVLSMMSYFCFKRGVSTLPFVSALLVTAVAAVFGFFWYADGTLLFTDDHPCFLYRLIQLKENFPKIPFYNPQWNAGVEAREFFPSGALNIFLLFSPLIYLFDVTSLYTGLVLILLFVLVPLFSFLAGERLGHSLRACAISATLSLCASLFWYRWALAYGTMGFLLSVALMPINLALLSRFFTHPNTVSFRQTLVLALLLLLMFLWSPSVLLFLPLAIPVLLHARLLVRSRQAWCLVFLLLLLNLPWMTVFLNSSRVGDFLSSGKSAAGVESTGEVSVHDISKFKMEDPKRANLHWTKVSISRVREYFGTINPLLLFFGFSGLLILARGGRAVFAVTCLSAFCLGVFGPFVKPQLELERMLVVLALLLAVPAGNFIHVFLNTLPERNWARLMAAALSGVLFVSPYWIWRITTNHTSEHFSMAGPEVSGLISAIKEEARGGRVLFAGFVLHELNNGHVAPLAAWTDVPLIASSYQHDRWRYTEIVPREYKEAGDAGMQRYFDLMNISAIAVHDRDWMSWFSGRPQTYERVWGGEKFQLYRRKNFTSNFFLEGSGKVLEMPGNAVFVEVSSSSAILKFSYLPFLKADGCELGSFKVDDSFSFIRLENCRSAGTIKIESKSPLERFF